LLADAGSGPIWATGILASSPAATIASDFAALGYFLLGLHAVGFIAVYAITCAIGTSIRYAGGRLLLHAVVLAFFLVPIVGREFPFPAGLMLLTGTEPAPALACIAVGTLAIWIVAWWWEDTMAKSDLADLADLADLTELDEQAPKRSDEE
jgi:hypothetical protein